MTEETKKSLYDRTTVVEAADTTEPQDVLNEVEDNNEEEPIVVNTTTISEVAKKPLKMEEEGGDLFGDEEVVEKKEKLFEPRFIEGNFVRGNEGVKRPPRPFKKKKVINPELPIRNIDQEAIISVRGTLQSVMSSVEDLPEEFLNKEENLIWWELMQEASERTMLPNDRLYEATIRKGSMWVNMVNVRTEDDPQHVGMVTDPSGVNPRDANDKASIQRAALSSVLGLGTPDYVPLWHTGIWLKLRVPTAAALAALDEALVSDKTVYGNMTHGQIFSNDSAFFRKRIADFILDHVEWSTAPDGEDPDYLKSIIKTTDFDQLAWGMALARYPDGFDFAQPCTVNPKECQHVVEGRVDLRTFSHTDENKLTERQKRLMNNPRRRLSEEEFKAYQDEFGYDEYNRIVLVNDDEEQDEDLLAQGIVSNGVVIHISIPTLEKEESYSIQWINELKRNAENTFREKSDEKARNERIAQLIARTNFKTHGQWVESIELYKGGQLISTATEDEDINEMLEIASGNAGYSEKFKEAIHKFIIDNILTVIGVVNYECPNCGRKHETSEGSHYLVLPINVNTVFFTLIRCAVMRSSPAIM